jgi:hypothetical protein
MANRTRGAKKAAAARKGHKKTTKKKSHAGVVKAARARWGKGPIKRTKKK